MIMDEGFVSGGHWLVANSTIALQLRIVEACNFESVIKFFWFKING
jgi:hypothetical protein